MKRNLLLTVCFLMSLMTMSQSQRFYTSDRLSSNQITNIRQDKAGYIWIGTEYGLNKYDGYRFTNYLHEKDGDATIASNVISFLFIDAQGTLWVGTQRGLDRYDADSDEFRHVNLKGAKSVPRINYIIQEDENHLLIGTAGYGLFRLDTRDDTSQKLEGYAKGDTNYFSYIHIDEEGAFWKSGHGSTISRRDAKGRIELFESPLGTVTGFIDYEGGVLMICIHGMLFYQNGVMHTDYFNQGELSGKELLLRTAMRDRHGNLFIGTMGNGLYWIPKGTRSLRKYDYSSATFDLATSNVWALFEDKEDNLWVGCRKRGLLLLPQSEPLFRTWKFADLHINAGGSLTSMCLGDNDTVWCAVQNNGIFGLNADGRQVAHPASPQGTCLIYRDKQGSYWVGTNGGLYAYNPLTGSAQQKVFFSNGTINAMTDDGQGHLFFSVFSEGFCSYDVKSGELHRFNMHQKDSERGRLHNDWISHLFLDSRGKLWICTASGVGCYDPVANHFHPYGWEVILDYNSVETVCETSDNKILIGTNTGLWLYDHQKGNVEPFPHAEILMNKVVGGIIEDQNGDLWCSTTMGIWQYQARQHHFVNYLHGNGLGSREYVTGAAMHTADDRVWFGISDGITSFLPLALRGNTPRQGTVHLTGLYIGGNAVNRNTLSGGEHVITKSLEESDRIELSYLDNSFTMEFSLLNYINMENVVYEYRLNDAKEWTQTAAGNNTVVFTHLQPGSYELEVRACDNDVYTESRVYRIIVRSPWYFSVWAYLIYILLALAVLGSFLWVYTRRRKQKLDDDKMKFLINATHDIRSPLTLIMSPLTKLKQRHQSPEDREELGLIEHNTQRILSLVNQILDMRKIDKQQMRLQCQETNLGKYISGIFNMYKYNAEERNIEYHFSQPEKPLTAWIDHSQLDKVISNLLSNAFKYTFDGGHIGIAIDSTPDNQVRISVSDDGIGIKDADKKHIFDRFYQGRQSGDVHIEGTGIGLNLCKMIIEMHHGSIEVRDGENGKGSCFIVTIPSGNKHLQADEMLQPESKDQELRPNTHYRVLLVDDDADLCDYIKKELCRFYHIEICHNGREAIKVLFNDNIDLVISDVMMPEMDGFTLLRMMKKNPVINHIPVIMLTSKVGIANRLEGLNQGADAFMPKPFNIQELHVLINNLINNVLRLKGKFSGAQQQKENVSMKEVKGNDEAFMERVMSVVNKHFDDSSLSSEMLASEVGLSKSHLQRRIKEITGLSTAEFVRNLRLEQAARLLEEQKVNVSQVAYAVGFVNMAHFSTVFKKHFGVSPTDYIRSKT